MLGGAIDSGSAAAPVILICRSGRCSIDAGKLLVENWFDEVFAVLEGFEGELDNEHQRSMVGVGCFTDCRGTMLIESKFGPT